MKMLYQNRGLFLHLLVLEAASSMVNWCWSIQGDLYWFNYREMRIVQRLGLVFECSKGCKDY